MTTLDERLRTADPAAGLPAYSAAETDALLGRVLADAETRTETVARRRRPVKWAVLAAAALLTVGLVVFPGLGFGRAGATATASGVLDRAKLAAVDPPARPDQYWKITTRAITNVITGEGSWGDPNSTTWLRHFERTTWVAVDGSRPSWYRDRLGPYVRQVDGPPADLPTVAWHDSELWTTNLPGVSERPLDVRLLPRDPGLLRAALYAWAAGRGVSADDQVVTQAADILRQGLADAALRSALFEVLKTVPGVDLVDDNVTLDGRQGLAVGRPEPVNGITRQLIFDTATGEFIGERMLWSTPDAILEDAVTRELVDAVDPDVLRDAVRMECTSSFGGGVLCRRP